MGARTSVAGWTGDERKTNVRDIRGTTRPANGCGSLEIKFFSHPKRQNHEINASLSTATTTTTVILYILLLFFPDEHDDCVLATTHTIYTILYIILLVIDRVHPSFNNKHHVIIHFFVKMRPR